MCPSHYSVGLEHQHHLALVSLSEEIQAYIKSWQSLSHACNTLSDVETRLRAAGVHIPQAGENQRKMAAHAAIASTALVNFFTGL